MPSMSGWVLRAGLARWWCVGSRFLCPRCRAGCCEDTGFLAGGGRYGFYALDVGLGVARSRYQPVERVCLPGFYALDVGLGVARSGTRWRPSSTPAFLCPRCRAGCCEVPQQQSGMGNARRVSMPSMSGWVLRGRGQVADLLFCTPFLCPRCRAGCCEGMLRFGACEQGGWGRLRHPCLGGECSRPTAALRAGRRAVSWEDALRQPGCSGWSAAVLYMVGGAVHGGRCCPWWAVRVIG